MITEKSLIKMKSTTMTLLVCLTMFLLFSIGHSQDRKALSLTDLEDLLRAGVTSKRLVTLIEERGVDFEVTKEIRQRLRSTGAGDQVIQALEKAGEIFSRRKLEEKLAEEKQKEEEKRRAEEEQKKIEEEKRRIEEAQRHEEEKRKAEEEARRRDQEEIRKRDDGAERVLVPAGEFAMGSKGGTTAELPVHRVYLDAFYIDKFEVTNLLYARFTQATGRKSPGLWKNSTFNAPNQPVVGVSWYDAEAYCKSAGKRLPTEAEWEKAARGTDERRYPWGDQWDSRRANTSQGGPGRPTPIGSYEQGRSPYGAYDMAGNVWEWVADWYDPTYYAKSPTRNPAGPDNGRVRVRRGGGWRSHPQLARTFNRFRGDDYEPDSQSDDIGFRCVKAP